jgi:hypothetical protein
MKTHGLPEREYLKLYKLVRKYQARWVAAAERGCSLVADRQLKKLAALVGRAVELERAMRVPAERRWTRGI